MKKFTLLSLVVFISLSVFLFVFINNKRNTAIIKRGESDIVDVFTSDIDMKEFEQEISTAIENIDDVNSEAPDHINNEDVQEQQVETAKAQEKVYGWGLVRNKNNQPPRPSSGYDLVLHKYGGRYLGDTSKKILYLTFDEGYENGYTPMILDTLKEKNVPACFFITGPYLNQHMDLVERMVNEGHVVGNHTVNHPSLPTVSNERIEKEVLELERVFTQTFEKDMRFLRPPMGEFSERSLQLTQSLGYTNVMWSFAYADWDVNNQKGADYAHEMVINNLHNGAILLLHAVSKDNAQALGRIIDTARELGYEFDSIENLS